MTDIIKVIDILPDEAKHLAQKLHRKKEDIEVYRKALVGDIESSDEERTIVARVSTNDRDRDGEIVEPKGIDLKDFQANPVLLWAHRYEQPPVGKALWSKTDEKGMVCKFRFAETQFAEDIYQLYKGGYLRAFSIGFIPLDFDAKTKTFNKVSILEVSAVPVPANQGALVMDAYAKGIVTSDALKADLGITEPVAEVVPEAVVTSGYIQVGDPEPAKITSVTTASSDPGDNGNSTSYVKIENCDVVEEKTDAPEDDPAVAVVDLEELDELTASIRDLALQMNLLIKRFDEFEGKAVAAAIVEAVSEPEVEAASEVVRDAIAPPDKTYGTITITPAAPAPKSDAQVVLDYLKSPAFKEQVALMVDKSIGRVR